MPVVNFRIGHIVECLRMTLKEEEWTLGDRAVYLVEH